MISGGNRNPANAEQRCLFRARAERVGYWVW
jgi:hypothetical protein